MKNQTSSLTKRRNPIIAFTFSFLIPGLGQLYNGHIKKALLFFILVWGILGIFYVSGFVSTFKGLIMYLTTDIILRIYIGIDSIILAKRLKTYKVKVYNRWYFYILFVIIVYFFNLPVKSFLKTYFKCYELSGFSMENTLLKGDYILCDMKYYNNHEIQRDNVIVFEHNGSEKHIVYRVVGLPNDKIEIINKNLYVNDIISNQESFKFINSKIIPRNHGKLNWDEEFIGSKDNFGPITVPENQYFILGDNFDISADSRYVGCVQKNKIIGKPLYVIFSIGEEPINDYRDYMIYDSNPRTKIRKSRIGVKIE